jgi:YbbR domain-containing protein
MKQFLFTNVGWKLLSLLLAFLLWIAIAQEPELTTSISVPILFRNVPQGLEVATENPIDQAHLEIRGPSGRLTATNLAQVAVVFNLSSLQPGERTFTIRDNTVWGLPLGVVFSRAIPSQISLHFEHQITKDVPVEPVYEKPPAPGSAVVNYRFVPPIVRIRGPQERVQDVDHVTTDPIDLTRMRSKIGLRVHVRVPDQQIRLDSSAAVVFFATIERARNKESK